MITIIFRPNPLHCLHAKRYTFDPSDTNCEQFQQMIGVTHFPIWYRTSDDISYYTIENPTDYHSFIQFAKDHTSINCGPCIDYAVYFKTMTLLTTFIFVCSILGVVSRYFQLVYMGATILFIVYRDDFTTKPNAFVFQKELDVLKTCGFTNKKRNKELLKNNNGDIAKVIEELK